MDTWTTQPGYPLIRVNKVGTSRVYISQERFLPAGETAPQTDLWEVPITVVTQASDATSHVPTFWLTKDTLMTSREHDTSKWLLLNPDAFGYYRVMYDDQTLKLIQAELNVNNKISGLSRSQLVDDYFTFAQHGHGSITAALDMTTSFFLEKDYVVWYTLFRHLTKTLQMFNNQGSSNLKSYLTPKLDEALRNVSWTQPPNEAGTKVIYRSRLADWACALESDQCKVTAKNLMDAWQATPAQNPIGLDLQPVLYCAIVAQVDGGYDFIMDLFNKPETTDFQKGRLLNALACSQKDVEIRNLLELALDPNSVISKSTVAVYQRAAGNKAARRIVFDLIRDDATFAKLKSHTDGVTFFSSIVTSLSTYLNSESERTDLQTFIESKREELNNIMNSLNNSLNAIRSNEDWMAKNFNVMNTWFQSHTYL